jgi:hypothetical protein
MFLVSEIKQMLTGTHNLHIHKKVKVKVSLEQVLKAQRGSRGIAILFFNLGTKWRWVVNSTPRPLYPRE